MSEGEVRHGRPKAAKRLACSPCPEPRRRRCWRWRGWTRTASGSRPRCAARSSPTDAYLTEIASHLIVAGGKRLRPALSVVVGRLNGQPATDDVVRGGVACELVHLGSLYHDDVMDEAEIRRGVDTVNARWGNLQAILAGDFLLARASEIAASLGTEVAGAPGAHDLLAVRGPDRGAPPHLRHRPLGGQLPRLDPRQDGLAVRHRGAHRRHRRRARPTHDRRRHRVRQRLRHGVPDRRRRARPDRHRPSNSASRPGTISRRASTRCPSRARCRTGAAAATSCATSSASRSSRSSATRRSRSCAPTTASRARSPPASSYAERARRGARRLRRTARSSKRCGRRRRRCCRPPSPRSGGARYVDLAGRSCVGGDGADRDAEPVGELGRARVPAAQRVAADADQRAGERRPRSGRAGDASRQRRPAEHAIDQPADLEIRAVALVDQLRVALQRRPPDRCAAPRRARLRRARRSRSRTRCPHPRTGWRRRPRRRPRDRSVRRRDAPTRPSGSGRRPAAAPDRRAAASGRRCRRRTGRAGAPG